MPRNKYGYLKQRAIKAGKQAASCPPPLKLSELGLSPEEQDAIVKSLWPQRTEEKT